MNDERVARPVPPRSLEPDLETAERILTPAFQEADRQALGFQRRFHGAELAIIYGGVVAAACGLGASLSEHTVAFAFTEVVITAALGSLAFISRGLKWQRRWLRHRLVAETLRGERFLFVGRLGPYADAAARDRLLEQRVVEIERSVRQEAEAP